MVLVYRLLLATAKPCARRIQLHYLFVAVSVFDIVVIMHSPDRWMRVMSQGPGLFRGKTCRVCEAHVPKVVAWQASIVFMYLRHHSCCGSNSSYVWHAGDCNLNAIAFLLEMLHLALASLLRHNWLLDLQQVQVLHS